MTSTAAPRPWHADTPEDAIHRLSGSPDGLSSEEAARRLSRYGPNDLTRRRSRSAWTVAARRFTSPLIYALLASAGVAYAFGEVADGSVVLGVVVRNAAIGFGQEYPAGRAIEALASGQVLGLPGTASPCGWAARGVQCGDGLPLPRRLRV